MTRFLISNQKAFDFFVTSIGKLFGRDLVSLSSKDRKKISIESSQKNPGNKIFKTKLAGTWWPVNITF